MSRTTRRRAIRAVAPVAGLLAAGLLVWQGSYAAFSATSTNQSDAWTTGNLVLENNGGAGTFSGTTSALFVGGTAGQAETAMKPGATGTKCITVRDTGSLGGVLKLYRGAVSGTNANILAPQLSLTIDAATVTSAVQADCSGFPALGTTSIASGVSLNSLPTSYAGASSSVNVASNAMVAYRISWTFVSSAADNSLMNSSAQADLTWEAQTT